MSDCIASSPKVKPVHSIGRIRPLFNRSIDSHLAQYRTVPSAFRAGAVSAEQCLFIHPFSNCVKAQLGLMRLTPVILIRDPLTPLTTPTHSHLHL